MKLFIKHTLTLILLVIIVTMNPNPSASVLANSDGSVFDCIYEDCKDNETPVDEQQTDTTENQRSTNLTPWDYIKTIFALVFVIGLLYGLLKFINRKNRSYDKNRLMKNMGGISLGQNKSMQLVLVGEKYYLIGVGDDINLIKEITDPAEIERFSQFYEDESIESTTHGLLERILTKIPGPGKKVENTNSEEKTSNFSTLFKTKLDEIKEERKRHISRLTEKERNENE